MRDGSSGTPFGEWEFAVSLGHLAQMNELARMCHPSSRISTQLIRIIGLAGWPEPELPPAARYSVEAAYILADRTSS